MVGGDRRGHRRGGSGTDRLTGSANAREDAFHHGERVRRTIGFALFEIAFNAVHLIGHVREADNVARAGLGKGAKTRCFHLDGEDATPTCRRDGLFGLSEWCNSHGSAANAVSSMESNCSGASLQSEGGKYSSRLRRAGRGR